MLLASALSVLSAAPVEARPLRPGETVLDRPRPETRAPGGRLGRIWIRPALTTALVFDDNVVANDAQREADLILRAVPSVSAEADWRGHRVAVSAKAERGAYRTQSQENYLDWEAEAFGRLRLHRRLHASATARWQRGHVPRSSADDPADARVPTVYRGRSGEVVLKHAGAARAFTVRVSARSLDYDDVPARGGGTVNNDDRDRWIGEFEVAERWTLSPRLDGFGRSRANLRRYVRTFDDRGFARDSIGHATVAGVTWRPTGLTTVEGYGGVRQQVYADPRFAPLLLPTAGIGVTGSPTQLTSAHLALDQSVRETTEPAASGRLVTALSARVDHELRRDLLLGLHARYAVDDYRGISRRDRHVGAGLDLTYLAGRHLHARLSVRHDRRDSSRPQVRTFRRNRIELGLEVRY